MKIDAGRSRGTDDTAQVQWTFCFHINLFEARRLRFFDNEWKSYTFECLQRGTCSLVRALLGTARSRQTYFPSISRSLSCVSLKSICWSPEITCQYFFVLSRSCSHCLYHRSIKFVFSDERWVNHLGHQKWHDNYFWFSREVAHISRTCSHCLCH